MARDVLRTVGQGAHTTGALGAALDASGLDERDRRLAAEIVHGVSRHRARIDRALDAVLSRGIAKTKAKIRVVLRVAAYQMLFLDRVPDHAAVDDAVRAARSVGGDRVAGFVNGALRSLGREGEARLPPRDSIRDHVEIAHSLPRFIVDELADVVGDEALDRAAAAMNRPASLIIRVNRLRATVDEVVARLEADHPGVRLERRDDCDGALVTDGIGSPERSPSFVEGLWTVQDIGAQLIGHLVAPAPEHRILDVCAGVGGKATHLAELTGDAAAIRAVDISANKLELLAQTAERLGIRSIESEVVDVAVDGVSGQYDRVIVDAPCTGLGVLRRHPEAKWRLTADDIGRMAALQATLLANAAACVAPGGALIYSVCTFTRAEGPDQTAAFLAAHPDFALDGDPLRTWPHTDGADAFYAARFVKPAC